MAPVFDDDGNRERVWHLATEREQIGPLTRTEIRDRFAGGDLGGRVYAWREGFIEWLPLATVRGFEDLARAVTVDPGEARAAEISSLFDSLHRIAGGGAWKEVQTISVFIGQQQPQPVVDENTGMLDIKRLARRYRELAPPPKIDPHTDLAIGSGVELPIVPEAVMMSLPMSTSNGPSLVKTLIGAAIALATVTIALAGLAYLV
jgi:hypothetical protein